MTSGLGKVSFSFSKTAKRPALQTQPAETVKKIDKIEYINSIEDNAVQVINPDTSNEKGPLVIPLLHPNLLLQSVIDTVKSRSKAEVDVDDHGNQAENKTNECEEKTEIKRETLDDMAAREILEDASKETFKKPESGNFVVPLATDTVDRKESTLDDYDSIPVSDFGLAMLRGMGWDPKKGIGKNEQIVKVTGPTLRPKGLGLGADKAIAAQKPVGKNVSDKTVLSKGCKVRITYGQYKNLYGIVEGFDDDAGRVNVFMSISNEGVSMNECFVQIVTPEEFSKYSKVINMNAYNNYKDKESGKTDSKNNRNISPIGHKDAASGRELDCLASKNYGNDSKNSQSSLKHKNDKPSSDSDDSDSKYSKRQSKNSSSKERVQHKKYDSSSDSDGYDRRHSKSKSSSKHSKHSKRRSKDCDSSDYEERSVKSRYTDSRQNRHRRDSSESDRDRKGRHKKSKKRRDRSRSKPRR